MKFMYFSKIALCYSDILLKKKHKLHLCNHLFSCNHTCYCVGVVSVKSISCYVMLAHVIKVDPKSDSTDFHGIG